MATRPEAIPAASATGEEREYIASQWKLIWWRFRRHRLAVAASIVLIGFYLVVLFPEFLSIHSPIQDNAPRAFTPPQRIHFLDGWKPVRPYVFGITGYRDPVTLGMKHETDRSKVQTIRFFVHGHEYKLWKLFKTDWHLMGLETDEDPQPFHPLGTDRLGRDMFSRIMYGTRVSMSIGLVGVTISLVLGILFGGISGYRGGFADMGIQRLIEFLRSIPTIPLWIALSVAVPQDWSILRVYFAITIIISLIGWTTLAREIRGRFLAMREEDFVIAAKLYGSGQLRIIFRHMIPSFISHIIASTTLRIPGIIIAETSLSFLGLGLRAPAISWGVSLSEAQEIRAVAEAPWVLVPGGMVIIAVLCFNFLGDGLRDAADPYSVQR